MQLPKVVEVKGIRVLTTKQIAEEYGASVQKIKQNFANNRNHFIDGKHYISLTGDDLKAFKNQVEKIDLVDGRASHLYLWTEKGALLHAKSLNTDKAWEVYDYLVDFYFRAKEKQMVKETVPVKTTAEKPKKRVSRKIDVEKDAVVYNAIQKVRNDLTCMDVLLGDCLQSKWESAYNKRMAVILDIVSVIVKDLNLAAELEPRILEEVYW